MIKGRQYKGKLSPEQAEKGIGLSVENANGLLDDANLLFNHNRYERAFSLAILAIEESGKPSIIRSILLLDDPKALNNEWKNYRKHTAKNTEWILPDLVAKGANKLEDFSSLYDSNSEHGQILDDLKQLSFYTDTFSKCKWSIPNNVVSKELAEMILKVARILVPAADSAMTTAPELELWIKHLKPIGNENMLEMKQALINCYNEAEQKGILKGDKTTQELINFVL
ncbi:MAG: AbiV family abortive infection protein [Bacteroidales bacterium]|nr:AbiV family abortive infection protein [Bacteroidales bacterium]